MRTLIVVVAVCLVSATAFAKMEQKQITYNTSKGKVVFTHSDHQDAEQNCAACHKDNKFGPIPGFDKEAAHKLCIDCHKQKAGPVNCEECHEK